MPLLTVDQLTISYGATDVVDRLSFQLEPGQRVGIVGANGSGKSSLLRAIAGELLPSRGSVTLAPRVRVAHLPQELEASPHESVYAEALHSRQDIMGLRAELDEMGTVLSRAGADDVARLLER
jgi:ATP-binding cassette subfamily F protein uup